MPNREKVIAIYVPESLIPGLQELSGPVLLYLDRLCIVDGFALASDEYVTSIRMQRDVELLPGIGRLRLI